MYGLLCGNLLTSRLCPINGFSAAWLSRKLLQAQLHVFCAVQDLTLLKVWLMEMNFDGFHSVNARRCQ